MMGQKTILGSHTFLICILLLSSFSWIGAESTTGKSKFVMVSDNNYDRLDIIQYISI